MSSKADKSGPLYFWLERLSAAVLVPLSIWFVVVVLRHVGADYQSAHAFLAVPVNAALMGLFILIGVQHMVLGVRMILEDYIHGAGSFAVLMLLNRLFGLAVAAASIYAIVKIAL